MATPIGTRCGRRRSAPAAATSERFTSGMPSRASREATIRSHASAISRPPAIAKPSTAAISGLRAERCTMPAKPRSPTQGRSPVTNALRSMPALNPLPAPVSTPTLRSSSASSVSSAPAMPSASAVLTALRASGRLRGISRTPSRRSVRTGSSGMPGTLRLGAQPRLREVELVLQQPRGVAGELAVAAELHDRVALGLERQGAQLGVGLRGVLGLHAGVVELGGRALGVLGVGRAQALDRRVRRLVVGRRMVEPLQRGLRRLQARLVLLALILGGALEPARADEQRKREALEEQRHEDGHERDEQDDL